MKKANKRQPNERQEPSAKSLRKVPSYDFSKADVVGRGPEGLKKVQAWIRAQRGQPKKGTSTGPTTTKTIRFSEVTWKALDQQAKKRKTTRHALLRGIIAEWLDKEAADNVA